MSCLVRSIRAQVSKMMACIAIGLAVLVTYVVAMMLQHLHDHQFGAQSSMCLIQDIHNSNETTRIDRIGSDAKSLFDHFSFLEQRCTSISKELDALQKETILLGSNAEATIASAAASIQRLVDFEVDYDAGVNVLEQTHITSRHDMSVPSVSPSSDERRAKRMLEMSEFKRSTVRLCFLQLTTTARRLATSLPRDAGNANGAFGCKSGLLAGIEAKALRDVEAYADSRKAFAYLGVHWSEIAINGHTAAPLFGAGPSSSKASSSWVRDSWGTIAPAGLVHAEELLSKGSQDHILIPRNPALSIMHARRLEEHAKYLEAQDQYDAAAQRYRAMAKLAEAVGDAALSAHALSRLSHTLKLHGSHADAIDVAQDAVALTMDPLAQFVLASARLSSGLLTTDASMKAAEVQLRMAAGQLPTEELEAERAKIHSEMMRWRWMEAQDISKCKVVPDAARFLICVIAKLVF